MNFANALRVASQGAPIIAFVGAGGKTSAMFQLARDLCAARKTPVLVTTTTHLGNWQASFSDHHLILHDPADVASLGEILPFGVILASGDATPDVRLAGVDAATLEALRRLAEARQLPLLIEADGARQRPLKAPADHEPVIPPFCTNVVVVAGLSGLGRPLDAEWVHRPERFAALADLDLSDMITPEALLRVLIHPDGGLKSIPAAARRVIIFTQADSPAQQSAANALASGLRAHYDTVLIAASQPSNFIARFESAAGIVLAAGEAKRFGQPKQLLDWDGEPLVRRSVRAGLQAGLSPVVVVTGAHADGVEGALAGLDVILARCDGWAEGQSASIRAGLHSLSLATEPPARLPGSAIFLLADQPYVTPPLVRALAETHARTMAPIVAPQVDGRRGNPVLFDRVTFPVLQALRGDVGGRALFSQYPLTWLPWLDASILLDVDTPDDYSKLLAG